MSRDPYEGLRHALAIIPLIQAHQGLTVEELAARSGLTPTQITEELQNLVMMCGVPPYAPNNYISFWIEDGRVFVRFADQFERPVRLVLQEALALLMALKPLATREHPYREAVEALREKILDVIGPEESEALEGMQRNFMMETRDHGGRIGQLRVAMAMCRELRIEYWSAHRAALSERVIQPYGMAEHGGEWYVIAHDSVRQKPVSFRVDRIKNAELLESEYEVPLDFDVGQWTQDRHFVAAPGDKVAEVLFSGGAVRYARDTLPRRDVTDLPGGRVLARVKFGSATWFLSWILQFGRGAEVLGPPDLRELVRSTCERIVAAYDLPLPEDAAVQAR